MNRSNLSNTSSLSFKKHFPYYYNHNQAYCNNKNKNQPTRSNSLIKFLSPNKTVMDYVEKRLLTKKIHHLDNISTGSCSCSLISSNNKDHYKGNKSPSNIKKKQHKLYSSSFNLYNNLQNCKGIVKQKNKSLSRETNESLIEQINILVKENEQLKKENMAYKLLFKQLEEKGRQNSEINNSIKTLSSHSNHND